MSHVPGVKYYYPSTWKKVMKEWEFKRAKKIRDPRHMIKLKGYPKLPVFKHAWRRGQLPPNGKPDRGSRALQRFVYSKTGLWISKEVLMSLVREYHPINKHQVQQLVEEFYPILSRPGGHFLEYPEQCAPLTVYQRSEPEKAFAYWFWDDSLAMPEEFLYYTMGEFAVILRGLPGWSRNFRVVSQECTQMPDPYRVTEFIRPGGCCVQNPATWIYVFDVFGKRYKVTSSRAYAERSKRQLAEKRRASGHIDFPSRDHQRWSVVAQKVYFPKKRWYCGYGNSSYLLPRYLEAPISCLHRGDSIRIEQGDRAREEKARNDSRKAYTFTDAPGSTSPDPTGNAVAGLRLDQGNDHRAPDTATQGTVCRADENVRGSGTDAGAEGECGVTKGTLSKEESGLWFDCDFTEVR